MVVLNSETRIQFEKGIFAIYRNNVIGFWDFYCGTNVGAGSYNLIPRLRNGIATLMRQ
jgi:hypothetical protein